MVCRSKHVEPSMNGGIINSITRLHLVSYFYWVWLYSFMTTALEGGEGSASLPGRSLHPGRTRDPLYRRLDGPQGRSGQVRKISPPPGFDPRTVQPVASHYTYWAIPGVKCSLYELRIKFLNIEFGSLPLFCARLCCMTSMCWMYSCRSVLHWSRFGACATL